MSDQLDTCRSCKARIRWARHARTGMPAPFDPDPAENGNCRIFLAHGEFHFSVLGMPELREQAIANGEVLYTNHFGTCPNAKSHRKAK